MEWLPDGFEQSRFVGGLTNPTAMAFAPDGSLFVAEQRGTLRVVDANGQLQETPFLDARGSIGSSGERGLLGVALDPDFANNNYVYVYYTRKESRATPAHNRVARYTASVDDQGNVVAEPGSWKLLLRLANLRATNHNGGAIHFGSDGKLYVAVGENAREELAQSLKTRLGKILRINKDGTIPTDNPFYDRAPGSAKAIWARGLRNPYSFDVQPGTGKIFINDVGKKTWEEINEGEAGANYGWPRFEGPENNANTEAPLFAYRHGFGETTGCAITGGAFYNPRRPTSGPTT